LSIRTCFFFLDFMARPQKQNYQLTCKASDSFIHFPVGSQLEHRAPFAVSVISHTFRHTVGLLWTRDQPVAETSTYTGQQKKQSSPATRHGGSWGERRYSSSFLTSALYGVSDQRHAPAALCPGERTPGTHYTRVWVGLRAGLDTRVRGNILCPCRGSNPDLPVVQSVVRHYTDWAIPAPTQDNTTYCDILGFPW
jgi:hypothetical protein